MDEKTDMIVQFLEKLWAKLEQEPWLIAANQDQIQEARLAVERAVFSQVKLVYVSTYISLVYFKVK